MKLSLNNSFRRWRGVLVGGGIFIGWFAYNLWPESLIISVCFHCGFIGVSIAGLTVNGVKRYKLGPEKHHPHAKSRYWATLIMPIIFAPFVIYYMIGLGSDLLGRDNVGLVSGQYVVERNHSGVMGYWAMQRIRVPGMQKNDPALIYFLRIDLLKEGQVYRLTYSPRSRFILTAQNEPTRQP